VNDDDNDDDEHYEPSFTEKSDMIWRSIYPILLGHNGHDQEKYPLKTELTFSAFWL